MANLNVTIVIRTTNPEGKRRWVRATGKKNDPSGPLYLRYCVGSDPKYFKAGNSFQEAEVAKIRLIRKLKIESVGGTVPEDVPADKSHRISEVVAAYIADISKPDANNDCRSRKTIKEKQTILNSFVQFCGKTNIEELQGELGRKALTDYRDHLFTQEYEPDTVHKMMLAVVSWLKNNPVFPILKILKKQDWPDRKKTVPDPYTDAEIEGMLGFASPIEALIIRMFRGTGMREQELAHAELEDINWDAKYIQVHRRKPKFNWRSKNKAAKRQIPLGDSLLSDLKDHEPGLLFPHPKTGGVQGHLLRMVKRLATLAGVTPTTAKPHRVDEVKDNWCHRFRDTYITQRVAEARNMQDLLTVRDQIGHSNFETLAAYTALVGMQDKHTRDIANKTDKFGAKKRGVKKPRPYVVKDEHAA